jgi:hypothetical protein
MYVCVNMGIVLTIVTDIEPILNEVHLKVCVYKHAYAYMYTRVETKLSCVEALKRGRSHAC